MIDLQDRVVAFTGIHNFRDYGGYAARDGQLKRKVLWRSGHHAEATADDLDKVHALGLSSVIDLRGDSERAGSPCLRHSRFEAKVLFHPGETASAQGKAVHEESAGEVRTAADAHQAMVRLYASMPWRPVLVGTYRLYFGALAGDAGPSLLHCLAGKDRTGLAAALTHHLLGVHADDAMADYLLTNSAGNIEARIDAGARHVRSGFGRDMDMDAVRTLMSVHPEFLDTAFAAIEARHGNIEAYAADMLGVTPDMIAQMKQNLIG
ncbi:tyrosine-protein phosphatase [Novosphingobium sp.]|uniref:tyrosine-protein phosphatase n=1 Tax=Novosphingobium sp. TaxID=1874826 RepID=UPI0025DF1F5F|nr:tyrosine-protein phosphatase [Novosphingobium sp.]